MFGETILKMDKLTKKTLIFLIKCEKEKQSWFHRKIRPNCPACAKIELILDKLRGIKADDEIEKPKKSLTKYYGRVGEE